MPVRPGPLLEQQVLQLPERPQPVRQVQPQARQEISRPRWAQPQRAQEEPPVASAQPWPLLPSLRRLPWHQLPP
jgi:hypothetical protein